MNHFGYADFCLLKISTTVWYFSLGFPQCDSIRVLKFVPFVIQYLQSFHDWLLLVFCWLMWLDLTLSLYQSFESYNLWFVL